MKTIAHELDGNIVLQTFVDPNAEIDFDHIVLTDVPPEPIESWIIEKGAIKIDQEKLTAFNRSQLQLLTRRQFKLTLLENDLLETIELKIDQIEDPKLKARIQIEYLESEKFERTSESVIYMINMLELTAEQVDQMWLHAMLL